MARHTEFAALILALLALVATAPSQGREEAAEVDDGLDIYFRGADLAAMSAQALEEYPDADPGEAGTLERTLEDAPPQIPHSIADMLPITTGSNDCLDCHHPDNAASEEDRPLPPSHFQAAVMGEGGPGDAMAWKVKGYERRDDVAGARFNCVMCHAPQAVNVRTMGRLLPPEPATDAGQGKSRGEGQRSGNRERE